MVNPLIAGLIQMISLHQMNYYHQPDSHSRKIKKVQFGLPNNEKISSRKGNRCWYITIC